MSFGTDCEKAWEEHKTELEEARRQDILDWQEKVTVLFKKVFGFEPTSFDYDGRRFVVEDVAFHYDGGRFCLDMTCPICRQVLDPYPDPCRCLSDVGKSLERWVALCIRCDHKSHVPAVKSLGDRLVEVIREAVQDEDDNTERRA